MTLRGISWQKKRMKTLTPLLWLVGIAGVFTSIGLIGFLRRDVG